MEKNYPYIVLFYGFIALVLLAVSFWMKPKAGGILYYMLILAGFLIGAIIIQSYILGGSALVAGLIIQYKYRQYILKNRSVEVIFISDHDDAYLHYFMNYYRADISKHFPGFNFNIEDEFLVAILVSKMETVGLIIAEIKNADTLKICVDFMVPKHSRSQLAKTFYQCELRCIDFFGYRNVYIEPQSKVHNHYLESIGFRLVDGKYVNCLQ
jgi:hypothetical protein